MTETSMALEVITVTLNMDTVNFLGISIVGQSSARGDNGIYVVSQINQIKFIKNLEFLN